MPIVVKYDTDQNRVIRCEFVGSWTWSDYSQATSEALRLVESFPCTTCLILDFSQSNFVPNGPLSTLGTSLNLFLHRFKTIIIVSDSILIETSVKIFQRLSSIRENTVVLVKTLEQARELIAITTDAVHRQCLNQHSNKIATV